MIAIDRNKIPIPEIFFSGKIEVANRRLEEFYLNNENRKQQRLNNPFDSSIRKEIVAPLRELFNHKCAYCESSLPQVSTIGEIDQFRPKRGARGLDKEFSDDHYWWLTYEWRNLYYSCPVCNRYKSTWFPVEGKRSEIKMPYEEVLNFEETLLIDPCTDNPQQHIAFDLDGFIKPASEKGEITIELLKLNREDLVNARLMAIQEEFGEWEALTKYWKNDDIEEINSILSKWKDIIDGDSNKTYLGARRFLIADRLDQRKEIHDYFVSYQFDERIEKTNESSDLKEIIRQKLREEFTSEYNISDLRGHVYIKSLELKNFKCFKELKIDFNEPKILPEEGGFSDDFSDDFEKNTKEPWLVFLGENGVGKSSILQAIALCLMGDTYRNKLSEITPDSVLNEGFGSEGWIKLNLIGEKEAIILNFKKGKKSFESNQSKPLSMIAGYGSVRVLPKGNIEEEQRTRSIIKVLNLFDYSYSLTDAKKWLLKKDWSSTEFGRIAVALKDLLLMDTEKDQIERDLKNGIIWIIRDGQKVSLEQQSDGYKTVIALAVDIMAFFMRENVSYDLAEGIVLIDELGTHLHPRWKMSIVKALRRAFRKLQFIVTTHEPLCLRGLYEGEVVVLTKDSNQKIVSITELPDPSRFRVDQLLTSPFFGLNSAIDPDTEKKFDKYYSILAKPDKDRSIEEKERLLTLKDEIPKIKYLGDSLREELVLFAIDEIIAQAKSAETQNQKIESIKDQVKTRVKEIWNSKLTEDDIDSL